MLAKLSEAKRLPRQTEPEPTPVFVRVHTRVENEKERGDGKWALPDKWANYALVFDCETTIDIRQDLTLSMVALLRTEKRDICMPTRRPCIRRHT